MIKLFGSMADKALLVFLQHVETGTRPSDTFNWAYETWYRGKKGQHLSPTDMETMGAIRAVMERYRPEEGAGADTYQNILDTLVTLTLNSRSSSQDVDVIDTVRNALQSAYSRNALSGKTIDLLRKALLLPTERSALLDVRKKELSCAECGHEFRRGEMATFDSDGESAGAFYCQVCVHARFTRCAKCKEDTASIPEKAARMIQRLTCGGHKEGEEGKTDGNVTLRTPSLTERHHTIQFGRPPSAQQARGTARPASPTMQQVRQALGRDAHYIGYVDGFGAGANAGSNEDAGPQTPAPAPPPHTLNQVSDAMWRTLITPTDSLLNHPWDGLTTPASPIAEADTDEDDE